jgi:hypothetical protein
MADDKALVLASANNTDVAVSDDIINAAYTEIKVIFDKTFKKAAEDATLKIGQHLVTKFYGDYNTAKDKKYKKNASMGKLIEKFKEDAKDGNAPSSQWLYNAVNIAIDDHFYNKKDVKELSTYGDLGHSIKVTLLPITDEKIKILLIQESTNNKYTVEQLKKRIKELRSNNKSGKKIPSVSPNESISKEQLSKMKIEQLMELTNIIKDLKDKNEAQMNIYEENIKNIKDIISAKPAFKAIFNLE